MERLDFGRATAEAHAAKENKGCCLCGRRHSKESAFNGVDIAKVRSQDTARLCNCMQTTKLGEKALRMKHGRVVSPGFHSSEITP